MSQIKILIKGYAKEKQGSEFASSTTTLIQDKGLNVVVDPGMNRRLLLSALRKEKLSPNKMDYVILTHYHPDHSLLSGIFSKAQILDDSDIYSWDGKIEEHNKKVPGTEIKIIETPGHDLFHCSILVKTKQWGKVVIAGDLFWWEDQEKQKTDKASLLAHRDPYLKDKKALIESRRKILKIADYIIPGHGEIFRVSQ